jgi:hypothetical protein
MLKLHQQYFNVCSGCYRTYMSLKLAQMLKSMVRQDVLDACGRECYCWQSLLCLLCFLLSNPLSNGDTAYTASLAVMPTASQQQGALLSCGMYCL